MYECMCGGVNVCLRVSVHYTHSQSDYTCTLTLRVSVHVYFNVCAHVFVCVGMFRCGFRCGCICLCMYMCVCFCWYVYMYMCRLLICVNVWVSVCVCIWFVCVFMLVYGCMFLYKSIFSKN